MSHSSHSKEFRPSPLPSSVNFHLWHPCNMKCRYCFATFRDVAAELPKGHLRRNAAIKVARLLGEAFEKVTFAGGEPLLCPWLPDAVAAAKDAGATTMLVTNGSRLDARWGELAGVLDWVAISVDSAWTSTHASLGRAVGGAHAITAEDYVRLARKVRKAGKGLKINTVVTKLNAGENLSELIRRLRPERWKILRAITVRGQNDGVVDPLLCSDADFRAFVDRHRALSRAGIVLAAEDTDDIVGSYAMVDPRGRFFDDTERMHRYSAPILDVGLDAAWSQIRFSMKRYVKRGARYAFAR